MKSGKAALAALCSVVLFTGCSGLSTRPDHRLFERMDVNDDERVTIEEFSDDMKQYVFDGFDEDGNRVINREEWEHIANVADREKHEELFRKIDTSRDKRITFLEFSDYADKNSNIEKAFMVNDRDKDNSLSRDEISVRPIFRMITIKY